MKRYRKVAFLECDVGQSEFTPGAMVALNIVDQPVFGMIYPSIIQLHLISAQVHHLPTPVYPTWLTTLVQHLPVPPPRII